MSVSPFLSLVCDSCCMMANEGYKKELNFPIPFVPDGISGEEQPFSWCFALG